MDMGLAPSSAWVMCELGKQFVPAPTIFRLQVLAKVVVIVILCLTIVTFYVPPLLKICDDPVVCHHDRRAKESNLKFLAHPSANDDLWVCRMRQPPVFLADPP